ncbi:MAG: hypothetical protein JO159_14195 [Acidobacteria bacterium]|nr:hypothetical protein [Acidobacteriota bacterium]
MSSLPSQDLEFKAAEERRRLHGSVVELKSRVRDRLGIKNNTRNNFGLAAGAASFLGLISGYMLAGIFVHHKRPQ